MKTFLDVINELDPHDLERLTYRVRYELTKGYLMALGENGFEEAAEAFLIAKAMGEPPVRITFYVDTGDIELALTIPLPDLFKGYAIQSSASAEGALGIMTTDITVPEYVEASSEGYGLYALERALIDTTAYYVQKLFNRVQEYWGQLSARLGISLMRIFYLEASTLDLENPILESMVTPEYIAQLINSYIEQNKPASTTELTIDKKLGALVMRNCTNTEWFREPTGLRHNG